MILEQKMHGKHFLYSENHGVYERNKKYILTDEKKMFKHHSSYEKMYLQNLYGKWGMEIM